MALSDTQVRQLRAKLDERHVRTRKANGIDLHYVEGWHVISEANRIFGYDAWDRRTLEANCVTSSDEGNRHAAAYTAKVRVTVRAGETLVVREGSGTGEGFGATTGQAHDIALKSAETDATKRALATFGNPFGLALYDREQLGVRRCKRAEDVRSLAPWILRGASGEEQARYDKPSEFALGLREALDAAQDIEGLFAVWEQNVDTVRAMNRSLKQNHLRKSGAASQLVAHLKRCAVALANPSNHRAQPRQTRVRRTNIGACGKIDKSALTIGHPKRIRCKEHLRFVSSQPCVICGRTPSHAHHVRYAQPRGLGLKVSDEFTVPLCATHHQQLHTTTKEREWWQERNIDPLEIARRLWQETRPAPAVSSLALERSIESQSSPLPEASNTRRSRLRLSSPSPLFT